MTKSSKFINNVNGGLLRKFIADKLHFPQIKLSKADWDEFAKKASTKLDDVPKAQRVKRARRKFLGKNPSRRIKAGKEMEQKILERMEREGKAKRVRDLRGKDTGKWLVKDPSYVRSSEPGAPLEKWVSSKDCDFGHHPVDAVDFWNNEGRFYGARSQHVRDWMNNPDNYEMQPKWYNQAEGRDLGNSGARYQPEAAGMDHGKLDQIFGQGDRRIRPDENGNMSPLSPFDQYRRNRGSSSPNVP